MNFKKCIAFVMSWNSILQKENVIQHVEGIPIFYLLIVGGLLWIFFFCLR